MGVLSFWKLDHRWMIEPRDDQPHPFCEAKPGELHPGVLKYDPIYTGDRYIYIYIIYYIYYTYIYIYIHKSTINPCPKSYSWTNLLQLTYLVGGWPTPLNKNMSSSVGMIVPNMETNVPNHQPVIWKGFMMIYGYGLEMKISLHAFKGQLDHAARIGFLLGPNPWFFSRAARSHPVGIYSCPLNPLTGAFYVGNG